MEMNLTDISTIRQILSAHSAAPRKSLGQNFLTNAAVAERIADTGKPSCASGGILEIGPGIGALTRNLAKRAAKVVAVELDDNMLPILAHTMSNLDNVEIVHGDFMKIPLPSLMEKFTNITPVSVCANLPYYITTPVLMKLLEDGATADGGNMFESITIMIQREVADRLCASAGSAEYGAITASVAYRGVAKKMFSVSAGNFHPAPKVESSVVRIDLYKQPKYDCHNEDILFRLIRAAFGQRRKMLKNAAGEAFSHLGKEKLGKIITSCGYREDIRGEKVDIDGFVRMANIICEAE